MKCRYCGKKTVNAEYCGDRCRKLYAASVGGPASRIAFIILTVLSAAAAFVGIALSAAQKMDQGVSIIGGGFMLFGFTLLAFPRGGGRRAALSKALGGIFFGLGLAVFLLWL